MLEKKGNDLELRIRIIKGEIRESKREKKKCWENVLGIIAAFICVLGGSFYYFFVKKEFETLAIILSVILLLLCLVFCPYWYNRYKSACEKIEQLEKELTLLKKGLKKGWLK